MSSGFSILLVSRRPQRHRLFRKLLTTLWIILGLMPSLVTTSHAQATRPILEGYVTAFPSSAAFAVNGRPVIADAKTQYGEIGPHQYASTESPLRAQMGYGRYVMIMGNDDKHRHAIVAKRIYLREDKHESVSGAGVVDRVFRLGNDTTFRADGYLLRVTEKTKVDFTAPLKSLADVQASTLTQFSGTLDPDGVASLSEVKFLPNEARKAKGIEDLEAFDLRFTPPDYAHKTPGKVKLSLIRGWHAVPADERLQERINRIGMNVVPAFQKALADDDPLKIHFRFYVIDNKRYRGEMCDSGGLVMIPEQVVERLKSDDQLAAVLADGVAFNLQDQWNRIITSKRLTTGVMFAGDIAGAFIPGVGLATLIGGNIAESKYEKALAQQRARVAVGLLSDAGYDLREAPVAWQLLAPKHPVTDPAKDLPNAPYPDISGYLINVLHLEYYDGARSAKPGQIETGQVMQSR
jgi:hypothetical protein